MATPPKQPASSGSGRKQPIKSGKRFFDVAPPGKVKPVGTSRPVIHNLQSNQPDPMFAQLPTAPVMPKRTVATARDTSREARVEAMRPSVIPVELEQVTTAPELPKRTTVSTPTARPAASLNATSLAQSSDVSRPILAAPEATNQAHMLPTQTASGRKQRRGRWLFWLHVLFLSLVASALIAFDVFLFLGSSDTPGYEKLLNLIGL